MEMGTQLFAPAGFDMLCKDVIYHLLRNDQARERVVLLEFRRKSPSSIKANPLAKDSLKNHGAQPKASSTSPEVYRPVLHYLSRGRFEEALDEQLILPCETQEELPPWFDGLSTENLRAYSQFRVSRKRSHDGRIDQTLKHLWPLIMNLDEVLGSESPDAMINAHARFCEPKQNETRLRRAFYAYIAFGLSRWSLHYAVHHIGRWSRIGRDKKFGRPSRRYGANHGYSTNDPEIIQKILQGYRRFARQGVHMSQVYRKTLKDIFGCVAQSDLTGRKSFIHPAGSPFPSLGQFAYRVAQVFSLEDRQHYKYGYARVRNRLTHSQGRYAESVGNLMERTEQDAYCCDHVAVGYLEGSHLPPLWVVRIRCIASGMIVGIGFSVGAERAAAYRMAQFCAAIDKVIFSSLFGIDLQPNDWDSIGISPHVINDRGPGCTVKADSADSALMPAIKEGAPSYSGQSKASIETMHPKSVHLEGKPQFRETRLTIPQLASQEILRAVADNHSTDVSDRLNNEALIEHLLPTPATLWDYLNQKGRNYGVRIAFEEAVRAYLDPIEVSVRDDGVYFQEVRFFSGGLQQSGALQKAHDLGRYKLSGYMMSACVRHLWIDVDNQLVQVDAMLSIRDGHELLYISVVELEQLARIRANSKLELQTHRLAARSEYEQKLEDLTGQSFDQTILRSGRSRRSKANSVLERQEIMGYLRAEGGSR